MREFFLGQMDYIFFVYGLAFILLFSSCISLQKQHKDQLPWNWLGAFGLIHGINEWLDMLALSLGDNDLFKWVRIVIMGVSFICLFEFGRLICERLNYVRIGRWIYVPLVLVILLEASDGMAGVNATIRYSLGLSGGLLAALGLWRMSLENREGGRTMLLAAGAMALYAIVAGFIPPKATVLLAGVVNHDTFLQWAGFPVQLLRAFAACGIGVMIWCFNEEFVTGRSSSQPARSVKSLVVGPILILVAMLAIGWFWADQQGRREATFQRAQLLSQAQQSITAVTPELVRDLSATAADVDSPEYKIVKTRLQHLRDVMPAVRFIYLMRQVEGKIVFLADSEVQGSKDESPPGQVYDEAAPRLINVFATGKGIVDDPTTDRWGSWVSAYVPFNDSRTGEMIAVLGVDQNARDFNLAVALGRLKGIFPVGIICFGVLFAFAYWRRFTTAMEQSREGSKPDLLVQWGMVVIIAGSGLTLTASLFLELRSNAESAFKATFLQRAITRVSSVAQELERQIDRLEGLRRFMDSRESVDRGEFSQYVVPLLKDVPIRAFEWIPRVPKAERVFYESSARQDGLGGFKIYERDAAGKKISVVDREDYFPVYYVEPLKGNEATPGYDLASETVRRAAMEKSRDIGRPVATPPLELVQQGQKHTGVLVFMPVYAKDQPRRTIEQRRQALKGYVLVVYSADDFLKGVYSRMPPEGLACLVEDLAAPADRQVLYRHAVRDGVVDWSRPLLKYEMSLEFPDRQWRITIVPSTSFIERQLSLAYWWVLLIGLFLTALMTVFLNFLMTARYQAERLVHLRTDELSKEKETLRESEERLSATMRSIGDGVIACDARGNMVTINAVTERLTGWSTEEASGRPVAEIFHIVHGDTRQEAEIPIGRALREDRIIGLANHTILIARDGSERQIADSCAPIHDVSGVVIGAVLVFRDVTEEYAQRELLRKSEESYRNQFAMNSAVMLLIDPEDGAIVDANAAAVTFYGYAREKLLLMKISDINTLPSQDVKQAMASVALGQGKRFQFQHRLADGSLRMVETAASHIQFGGRGLLHSIIFDITERKQAEDALAEQRKLLANVIEGTNVGTWRWQVLTGEALFNERWAEIMGYTLAELVPISVQTWVDLTHPDDLKKSEELLHQHFTGKLDYYDYECRMKHKNGAWVWVHDRGKVVEWTPEGKPLVMTGTHTDISERKQAEANLLQATDRLTMATRAGGVGIWDYDVVNNRLVWDEQMFRHYGITQQQFIGAYEAWQAGLHPEDRQRGDEAIQMALRGEKEFDIEFRVVWPDGSVHNIRGFAIVQRDASGKPLRMIGTNWDVTAQKKAEEDMNKMRLQLVQSDKLSTLGEMATGMAHEINQPLNAIALISTMFRKYMQKKMLTDERLTEGLRDIDAMVERMSRTIKHVRAYARQETLAIELVNLPATIDAALSLMGEQMRMHEIEVVKDFEPGLPPVNGESHQLEQVWINFISNARDSMDEKKAQIAKGVLDRPGYQKKLQISVSHDKASNMVLVAFTDNGMGINEEGIKKAFEPFFTTKEVGKGTGLGLSISMGIVESHKGKIEIEGKKDEGATLKVYLPVERG